MFEDICMCKKWRTRLPVVALGLLIYSCIRLNFLYIIFYMLRIGVCCYAQSATGNYGRQQLRV